MSDEQNNSGADTANQAPQINVLGQYVKDLSFENPSAPKSLREPGKNPNIQINFNVQAQSIGENMYEVELRMEAQAKSDAGVLYNLELVYAGGFALRNLPAEAIQPILFIECPALLFPYVRRLVSDMSREGGFPPLLIDPIDFAALYRQRIMQQQGEQPTQQ